ncbi:scarecrow-like protein 9 [Punica granatum]|uniref:Uncharacterized protein n=2 Tax=Punica granatum TaxID=22663 RepID=A0A218XAS9_PUNGR|nr:scarecrow-like protein 9 [Punica granatum]OWM81806.1 hypothetical protein CDL15_Pgr007844 [Punica granatum]PKI43468.1 hypothetical protein CRG98_036225 [Punica granatum]
MGMDPRLRGFPVAVNGISFSNNQPLPFFPDQTLAAVPRFGNASVDNGFRGGIQYHPPEMTRDSLPPCSSGAQEEFPEDCDFSDTMLSYIRQMLMEEDMEEKTCMLQDSLDLQAAEKSLYEAIGKKYPPSPEVIPSCSHTAHPTSEVPDDEFSCNFSNPYQYNYSGISVARNFSTYGSTPQSSYSPSNSAFSRVDGLVDSPGSILQEPDLASESQLVWQFRKGVKEASKFLPSGNGFLDNIELKGILSRNLKVKHDEGLVKVERGDEVECLNSPNGSRGRKNRPQREEGDMEEERSSKQAAVFAEPIVRSEMFDAVLLCNHSGGKNHLALLREALKNGTNPNMLQNGQPKELDGGKGRGKKHGRKKEVVDLRTLLINCAQAVATDDRTSTSQFLKQIRQHASPFGDGNQRLAHCLGDGLEARLAGTGSQIYKGLISKRTAAADILKAYHLFLAACPFRKLSNFVSNKTIINAAADSMRIHIIDFGILYGFQWPTLIQRLSMRPGGPPRIRITGIEFPQPGFRPAERVEETGHRLKAYAEKFGVPFEYTAIAKKWETIKVEELKIDRDEFLVVNCLYRAKNLLDETVAVDSPRNMVLNLIRKINPDIFIHGIVNGSYNAPFFVTRFREALFHFSALFDMLETLVPRENLERMLIEKEIFGREALNVIACEGWERVERPETYKQWQVRDMRAGFVQVPFDPEIVQRASDRVRLNYHKDFLIDEDIRWLLQGWKGRIIFALSCWKPA